MRKTGGRRRNQVRGQKEAAGARHSKPPKIEKRPVDLAARAYMEPLQGLYGETRVVMMTVDPYLVHAYWEVTDADLQRARASLGCGGHEPQPILRFHDITCVDFDGTNAHCSFDVEIDLRPRNWYVRLWSADKTYCVDLGLRAAPGHFAPLARSNILHVPRAEPSPRLEERLWSPPGDQEHETPLAGPHPEELHVTCETTLEGSQRTGSEVALLAAEPPCVPVPDDSGSVTTSISVAPPGPGAVQVEPVGTAGTPDLSLECEREFLPGLSSF